MDKFEKIVDKNKINIKKLDTSIKTYDYFTQNYFTKDTIVPSIHIGQSSRVPKTEKKS